MKDTYQPPSFEDWTPGGPEGASPIPEHEGAHDQVEGAEHEPI